jgi:hypothetical protein
MKANLAALAAVLLILTLSGCGSGDASKFDPDMARFAAAKRAQAMEFARIETNPVPAEVWKFFDAVQKNRLPAATNRFEQLRQESHRYRSYQQPPPTGVWSATWRFFEDITGLAARRRNPPPSALDGPLWGPIHETLGAVEVFLDWDAALLHRYGRDIIGSIPTNSIYFGGTDPGRFVITALSESHQDGKPFFVLTQNALADGIYLEYLRRMYGSKIYIATDRDSQDAFQAYLKDAQQRLQSGQLKPGEDVRNTSGRTQVSGQIAVMEINGLLVKRIFDQNPGHEFFIEESFPLDWMYPYLSPHGLILKLNREPLPELSEAVVRADHDYWQKYVTELTGGWLQDNSSLQDISDFAKKAYLPQAQARSRRHAVTYAGAYVQDPAAQKAFSKLRSAIGGLYVWRAEHAKTPAEKARMRQEADFAFRQAFALCPYSPEAVFRYVNLLLSTNRPKDAVLVAQTCLQLDPGNAHVIALLQSLKNFESTQPPK